MPAASAIHLAEKHSLTIAKATCVNLCHDQNITAVERAAEMNLSDKVEVVEASFDETPCPSNHYDLAFSQDAFIHAISKSQAYAEAYRVTKPGGAFVFCDLVCGNDPDLTVQELAQFAEKNRINDWLNPNQTIKTCAEAGWADVKFIDLSTDLRISFSLMLKKVSFVLEHGDTGSSSSRVLLMNYRDSICRRITQSKSTPTSLFVFPSLWPLLTPRSFSQSSAGCSSGACSTRGSRCGWTWS